MHNAKRLSPYTGFRLDEIFPALSQNVDFKMSFQVSLPPHSYPAIEQRRKRVWVLLAAFVVLGAMAWFFLGKPTYSALKGWRARRLAAKSEKSMEEKKWRQANETARAGYQLAPDEPMVLRAIAHLQSRSGNAAGAIPFWQQLDTKASTQDRRDYAEDLLTTGRVFVAEKIITSLLTAEPESSLNYQLAARVAAAAGKSLKVVLPLLRHLSPEHRYHVLFIERDLDEIFASQRAMLLRTGANAADPSALRPAYTRLLRESRQLLASAPQVRALRLSYGWLLTHPMEAACAIADFLGQALDLKKAAHAVDGSLHRQRSKI